MKTNLNNDPPYWLTEDAAWKPKGNIIYENFYSSFFLQLTSL